MDNLGTVQQFWLDCKTTAAKIERAITSGNPAFAHHPKPRRGPVDEITGELGPPVADGAYCTAIRNRARMTTDFSVDAAGRKHPPVAILPVGLAGQRIVEQTHRLSTPEEVAAYKQLQADNFSARQAFDNQGRGVMQIKLPGAGDAK